MLAVVIGSSGGIGSALTQLLAEDPSVSEIFAFSRSGKAAEVAKVSPAILDVTDEASIQNAAEQVKKTGKPDLVIIATGILSDGADLQPEKSYRHQSPLAFERVLRVNTIGPALVAKYFLPIMPRDRRAVFAALSARVGSISDNRLGGWHAYRASKAALNMLIRNYAIEQARRNADFICAALHPGTVDTGLSKPFQSNVPDAQLFDAARSAKYLLEVIGGLTPSDSGKCFDWKGEEIPA